MRATKFSELSSHTRSVIAKHKLRLDEKGQKLVSDLNFRKKYKVHYLSLALALKLGYQLKKIWRIVGFNQSCFLKEYVLKATSCRDKAASQFEKSYYKMKVNSIFGKLMEDPKRYNVLEITCNEKRLRKIVNKPNFASLTHLGKGTMLCKSVPSSIRYFRPLHIASSILDLSKCEYHLFVHPSIHPSFRLSMCLYIYLSSCLSFSICLSRSPKL